MQKFYVLLYSFCFVLFWINRDQFPSRSPGGKFIGGFIALRVWGAYIWRGFYMEELILRNFMDFNFNITYQCYSQNKGKELNRGSTD